MMIQTHLPAQHLSKSVYFLPAEGGNVTVCAGKDGAMIVDIPQVSEVARVQAALDQLKPGQFNFMVNTHAHGDHTAGNTLLGEQMPIIAHSNVRKRLQEEYHINVGIQASFPAQPASALPRLVFEDQLTLYLNNEEIRLIHFPAGHSDSDIIIWFTHANVAHLGDMFWPEMFPFVDVANGGSIEGLIQNVQQLLKLLPADIQIVPGHGPLSDISGLQTFLHMIQETTKTIRAQHKAGKNQLDITAAISANWQTLGTAFISASAWVEIVLFNASENNF
ncbi:MAG: MBL fold metallo-hydrolase [Anaerolineaceae bacterium]|nr:MBL fold metallo-hydrolase [Anaerolineaceae bacterium]